MISRKPILRRYKKYLFSKSGQGVLGSSQVDVKRGNQEERAGETVLMEVAYLWKCLCQSGGRQRETPRELWSEVNTTTGHPTVEL